MYRKIYLFLLLSLSIPIAYGQVFPGGLYSEIQLSVDDQVLLCDRSTLSFPSQIVGSSTEKVVTISNIGQAPLIVYGYDLSGFENFGLAFNLPFEGILFIPPGGQRSFTVTFSPSSPGTHLGSFTIQSSAPNDNTCQVSLYGLGLEPAPLLLRFTDDPLAGYEEVDCGGESFFDLTENPSDGNFRVHYSFRNQSDVPITVRAESTVVGGIFTNILNPIEIDPGDGGYHGPSFFLAAGDIYTILTTFFITLPDGTEVTCEYRVVVDKRIVPLAISFTDDPLAGYEPIVCGDEEFFDLVNEPDGTFRLNYSFQNTSSGTITVQAETTVLGSSITGILDIVHLEAAEFGYHGPAFNLAAGDIYTILTTFLITFADGSEITCVHTVIVDKRLMPIELGFSLDPSEGYELIECGDEEFIDLTDTPDGIFRLYYRLENLSPHPIDVNIELTVIEQNSNSVFPLVPLDPGDIRTYQTGFNLEAGNLYTIIYEIVITLPDGTEVICEHRVIVDKRMQPLDIIFSHDPAQGFESIECGGEKFFDLTGTPDGLFLIYYTFTNNTSQPITVRAESMIVGDNFTNILQPITIDPGDGSSQFHNFHLDAGGIYTIRTIFYITFEDGSEITCQHDVVVDKSTEVKPPAGDIKGYQAPTGVARLFPTVAQSQITLETNTEEEESYRIFNSLGQLMELGTVPAGAYRSQIPTDQLEAGSYFLKVGQHSHILRFVISRN